MIGAAAKPWHWAEGYGFDANLPSPAGKNCTAMIEYIRYVIPEDDGAAFEAAYAAAAVHLAASPHCVEYDLGRCHEDPRRYILRIRWDSLDGHLQGFRGSAHFREFFGHIRPYLKAIEEMQHYQTTGVAGTGAAPVSPRDEC